MKLWRKIHKWLGCLVAIQILLWISGGVVMSVLPIEKVRGKHLVTTLLEPQRPIDMVLSEKISISKWQNIGWFLRGNEWLIKAEGFNDNIHWLTPSTGLAVNLLSESDIKNVAESRHANHANSESIINLQKVPFEVRHLKLPMYQVNFDDWIHTSFYVDPHSGNIASVRSDIWRLYDFFWMLHIMDYQDREDFNHPLLIGAAILSLLFTFTGLILVYFSIIKPWYARVNYRKHS